MIRYALNCDKGHSFESWFRDSDAFDGQARRGFVVCPVCQSIGVRKAIMAPAISTRRGGDETRPLAAPTPLLDESEAKMRTLARQMRKHIVENSEDVGSSFPEQARAMHDGAIAARPIMGEATMAEAQELLEDGVQILPVPGGVDAGH